MLQADPAVAGVLFRTCQVFEERDMYVNQTQDLPTSESHLDGLAVDSLQRCINGSTTNGTTEILGCSRDYPYPSRTPRSHATFSHSSGTHPGGRKYSRNLNPLHREVE